MREPTRTWLVVSAWWLLTGLVGAGSLVSASPVRGETTERIRYSGHKGNSQARYDPGWIELASATPANS